MISNRLVLYKLNKDNYIYRINALLDASISAKVKDEEEFFNAVGELVTDSVNRGFYNNLWQCAIVNFIVNSENVYSLACELKGDCDESLYNVATKDFEIIYQLINLDLTPLEDYFSYKFTNIKNYSTPEGSGKRFNKRIRDRIMQLTDDVIKAKSPLDIQIKVNEFYKQYGVGKIGLHKAFRVENGEIVPVTNIAHVKLDDLVGYDLQKKQLTDNTDCFVQGKRANNCLLFGDAGTGKSTSIKAIANEYYDKGLRLIEIYKHQLSEIHNVIAQIKNRNYKFIIYMDDLSFEEFETEYKYLKAVIEGGLEKKPDNVLIYATSNRRHLIKETFKDRYDEDDKHKSDTVQEKLSLSYRFGVTIYFGSPSKKEFNEIVLALKERNDINATDEYILAEANKWEMMHGGLSGRCAQQFIDYIYEVCS